MTLASKKPPRDDALDALRGIAIFGMVLVNLQGSDAHVFAILAHAQWDGLTLADLVFPLFLLASGLALPLALDGRDPRASITKIVRRSMLLWLIGFSIGWIVHASTHLADIRFTGVLARIGIVYLVCALTCRATTGWRVPALAAMALMLVHGIALYAASPGGAASMAMGEGFSGWLDRTMLGGTRMYGTTFDPEGPLSTLSAIATAMIGVAAQRLTMRRAEPVGMLSGLAILCALGAFAAADWWPINKALWTPTFTLTNAAIGLALLAALKASWGAISAAPPVRLAVALGSAALTLYVVHALLTAILVIHIGGVRLWQSSFDALSQLGLPPDWTSLLYAVIAGALSVAITLMLAKRGWTLRV
jgi:predicted acyltransferase